MRRALSWQPDLPPHRLPRLVSWRWGAAVIVFAYHLGTQINWRPLRSFYIAPMGMSFFFMLSGLVLAWSWRPEHRAGEFFVRRMSRIYPSAVVMILAVTLLASLGSTVPFVTGRLAFLASLGGIQAWFPGPYPAFAYDGVCWSLSVELFLYVSFPLAVVLLSKLTTKYRFAVVAVAAAIGLVVSSLITTSAGSVTSYTNPLLRLPEFALGMVVGLELRAGRRLRMPMWQVALIVVGVAVAINRMQVDPYSHAVGFSFVVVFALALAALVSADLSGRRGPLTHGVSLYLGSISFSFYLVHLVMILVVVRTMGWNHSWSIVGGLEPLAGTFVACLVMAALLHHCVEVPAERFLRARLLVMLQRRRAGKSRLPAPLYERGVSVDT